LGSKTQYFTSIRRATSADIGIQIQRDIIPIRGSRTAVRGITPIAAQYDANKNGTSARKSEEVSP